MHLITRIGSTSPPTVLVRRGFAIDLPREYPSDSFFERIAKKIAFHWALSDVEYPTNDHILMGLHFGHQFGWDIEYNGCRVAIIRNARLAEELPWVRFDLNPIQEAPELAHRVLTQEFWNDPAVSYVNPELDVRISSDCFPALLDSEPPPPSIRLRFYSLENLSYGRATITGIIGKLANNILNRFRSKGSRYTMPLTRWTV
jgi:hypothetical protein